jgi:hypothetical protein
MSVRALDWKGTYVGVGTGVVERTTPVPTKRKTRTVAIQLTPGAATGRLLLKAAAEAFEGRHVLVTARDNGDLMLHAGTRMYREGEEVA